MFDKESEFVSKVLPALLVRVLAGPDLDPDPDANANADPGDDVAFCN